MQGRPPPAHQLADDERGNKKKRETISGGMECPPVGPAEEVVFFEPVAGQREDGHDCEEGIRARGPKRLWECGNVRCLLAFTILKKTFFLRKEECKENMADLGFIQPCFGSSGFFLKIRENSRGSREGSHDKQDLWRKKT